MDLQKGDCVRSLKGHDTGSVCYVVDIAEDFVYLADGKHRRIGAPKKKRSKHVSDVGRWAQ
ncbi:MAG: hypothetical protein H6Q61_1066 [Firmicutes bacterium]|nr:hypothetical protein [Bacillota bacterium]